VGYDIYLQQVKRLSRHTISEIVILALLHPWESTCLRFEKVVLQSRGNKIVLFATSPCNRPVQIQFSSTCMNGHFRQKITMGWSWRIIDSEYTLAVHYVMKGRQIWRIEWWYRMKWAISHSFYDDDHRIWSQRSRFWDLVQFLWSHKLGLLGLTGGNTPVSCAVLILLNCTWLKLRSFHESPSGMTRRVIRLEVYKNC